MRGTRAFVILFLTVLAGCSSDTPSGAGNTATSGPEIPTGQLGDAVMPEHYRLDLTILPDQDTFSGVTEIDLNVAAPTRVIFLHGNGLDVSNVTLTNANGEKFVADYEQVDETGVAQLIFSEAVPDGAGTLRIEYVAPFRKRGDGLHRGEIAGKYYAFTQFQPIDARRVFPGFDEPAFKTPFDITVTAHDSDVVIGNGPIIDEQSVGDGLKRVTLQTTQPLPTYLLAFAVGPLDVIEAPSLPPNEDRARPLPFRVAATRGNGSRLNFAIDNTREIVDYLEDYFAVAYPYPKLDLIASPERGTGAMENAGAIVYGDAAILLADNAPQEQRQRFVSVHAHELAHHWFGNLVTPKWWDDIWLNESFATWMGNKAAHSYAPEYQLDIVSLVQTLAAMNLDGRIAARQIRQPVTHNRQIASSFDGITYLKGGGVLAMFESYLGEAGFRDGIRRHMARFPHGVADVEDFMASLAEGSGRPDVVPAFRSFIDQPGVPIVDVDLDCSGDEAALSLRQSRYLPVGSRGDAAQSWLLPMCVRYGTEESMTKSCMLLDKVEATLPLGTAACPSFVMPNADGAGYYRFSLSDDGWRELMAGFAQLNQKEALAVAGSLSAAYGADRVSTAALIDAMRVVVASPFSQVAMAPARDLTRISEQLVAESERDAVRALMRELYRPHLEAIDAATGELSDAAAVDRALFRTKLVTFLALEARDPVVRAELVMQAERFVNDGEHDAVQPALLQVALAVAVQDRGEKFATALLERMLASNDVKFRSEAAGALAATDDDALGDWLRGLLLDDRLRGREPTAIAFAMAERPSQRRATLDWFMLNEPAFTADLSHFATRWLPRLGAGFCTLRERDEVEAYFAPLAERWPGAQRTLADVLEGIELCAALHAAKGAEADAYFSG